MWIDILLISIGVLELLFFGLAVYFIGKKDKKVSDWATRTDQLHNKNMQDHNALQKNCIELTKWEAELIQLKLSLDQTRIMNIQQSSLMMETLINQNKEIIVCCNQLQIISKNTSVAEAVDPNLQTSIKAVIDQCQNTIDHVEEVYFATFGRNYQSQLVFRSMAKKYKNFGRN
jgi:hypothetical protein